MKRILSLATAIIAAVCMNAGALMAQVTNLEFTNAYFEDNTNITETAWSKKNINFIAYTADRSYRANVKINTDHVAGTYTKADCGDYGLYLTGLSDYSSYYASDANIVVTQDGDNVNLVCDMTTANGESFHFTINYVKPEQVNVTMGGISIYDYSKPTYTVSGNAGGASISLSLTSTDPTQALVDGEYELGSYDNYYDNTFSVSVYFVPGSKVTVTNTSSWNGDPCVNIEGEVIGKNGVKYVIKLTSGIAEPDFMYQVNDANATTECAFREDGRWTLEGSNQNILVHLQMSKEDYAGVYDMKKWAFGYNNYMTINGTTIDIDQALVTVVDLGDEINATGWVMGTKAGKSYYAAINFTATKATEPAADGDSDIDVNVAFTNYDLSSDWMWGGWVINAENEAGYYVHLVSGTYWEAGDLPTGTYTVTNDWDTDLRITPSTYLEGNGGGWDPWRAKAPALSRVPNGSYVADADGNLWFIYKGTVTVNYVSGELNIVCDCVNTAGNKVQVAIGQDAIATGINSVISNDTKAKKYILNGKVVIEKDGKVFGIDGK